MKSYILAISLLFLSSLSNAQFSFQPSYQSNSHVPQGLLEAVAWTNTRMVHLEDGDESCMGIPRPYGIMGLHDNGKNYFIETGNVVAQLSGISIADQKASAENQILAYAIAFNNLMIEEVGINGNHNNPIAIRNVLHSLSEIPDSGEVNLLARDLQVYSILEFMNSAEKAQEYGFSPAGFNLSVLFGTSNYEVLSSPKIEFTSKGIRSVNNHTYSAPQNKSIEYGPAIWNPAAVCNISSRSGVAVSAITIHTVQGTYAGAISWAQNCASSVSYHYVIRSSDGQVTQMVSEADKAWHVGSENPYTVGYEHEGYVNNPAWYTEAMYTASSDLSIDIVNSGYGIPPLRTYYGPATAGTNLLGGCTKIKGHQHFANQTHTDPGINWNWEKYYRLINYNPPITTITNATGNLYDSGGAGGNYQDDERELWLIEPVNTQDITLNFTAFNVELNYDYLFIYDGNTIDAPLIGMYTGTNSPGIITSSGGAILIEFRSDCSSVSSGWAITYTSTDIDMIEPTTVIVASSLWQTANFSVDFNDQDAQSGIANLFYLVGEKEIVNNDWSSNGNFGFAHETFEDNANNWTLVTGVFALNAGAYAFSDINEGNSNAYLAVDQTVGSTYLYEWDQTITSSSTNQRAGMHFFCDNPTLPNRGNSYFIYLRETNDKAQIYSVDNDVFTLQSDVNFTVNQGQTYNCKTIYDPSSGLIKLYIDNELISQWQDATPLTSGGSISLRTGNCATNFDGIRVYKSRGSQVLISAGAGSEMSIESESAIETGYVRSLVIDNAGNWSAPAEEVYLLDFSIPELDFINDGSGSDIDTLTVTTIEANWLANDIHSDIAAYEVAVGTAPNLDDVYPWTSNGLSGVLSTVLSNPVYDQIYYISISATNNAGLIAYYSSNGQRYVDELGLNDLSNELEQIGIYPNPASETIAFTNAPENFDLILVDANGKICRSVAMQKGNTLDVSDLADGNYNIVVKVGGAFVVKAVVVKK